MKKFTALFLILSLVTLYANLYAKERRGATLIIQRKSDQIKDTRLKDTPWETYYRPGIKGELIVVKPNSLLLLDTEGKDVSVGIEDIKVIKIVEKPGVAVGALAGLLGGVGFVALREINIVTRVVLLGALSGWQVVAVWTIAGALLGALLKESKKIKIEGKSDSEIEEALEYLRKKARIRDYR